MSIGLILLAAGGSRRLGTPKQLLRDGTGRSLVQLAAQAALDSACRPIVVVLGAASDDVGPELSGLPLQTVLNSDWQTGLASSLRTGLDALSFDVPLEAVIVMLCDQPKVTGTLLDALVAAYRSTGPDIVACDYGDVLGVPALFSRAAFGALSSLNGDKGARHVLRTYEGPVARIPFPDGLFDIDTPQDARALGQTK